MDFEKQKPVTEQYRRAWERVFRPKESKSGDQNSKPAS
jgi:hypothetical protein